MDQAERSSVRWFIDALVELNALKAEHQPVEARMAAERMQAAAGVQVLLDMLSPEEYRAAMAELED